MDIRWTQQAAEDLQSIHEFISRDSPAFASLVLEKVVLAIEKLVDLPDLGRVVPEWGDPAIREIIRAPYRLIYKRGTEVVEILTVFHSSRHLPEIPPGEGGTA